MALARAPSSSSACPPEFPTPNPGRTAGAVEPPPAAGWNNTCRAGKNRRVQTKLRNCSAPPHLRRNRTSANLLRTHRPKERTAGGNGHPPKCDDSVEMTRIDYHIG